MHNVEISAEVLGSDNQTLSKPAADKHTSQTWICDVNFLVFFAMTVVRNTEIILENPFFDRCTVV